MNEIRGWKAFEEKYKPKKNHFGNHDDVIMYETYGDEVDYVIGQDNQYVWTWVQGDMSDLLVAGYHFVNRLGYYICEIPWTDEDEYVLLSVEVECECYDEDVWEDYGDPDCKKCEGYGLVTEYVGD